MNNDRVKQVGEALAHFTENKDEYERQKSVQKKFLTDLSIETLPISESDVASNLIFSYPFLDEMKMNIVWCRFPFSRARTHHEHLRDLFDREMGDMEYISDPDHVYLFCVNLFSSCWKPSRKWVVAGGFPVTAGSYIPWVWLHPFFRNKSLMKKFFVAYSCSEAPVYLQPPISPQMAHCMRAFSKEILDSEELLNKHTDVFKKFFAKKHQLNSDYFECFSCKDMQELNQGLQVMYADAGTKGMFDVEVLKKTERCLIEFKMLSIKDPSFKERMARELDVESYANQARDSVANFMKYGAAFSK